MFFFIDPFDFKVSFDNISRRRDLAIVEAFRLPLRSCRVIPAKIIGRSNVMTNFRAH